jgi:exodeoxyribonuclease V beta subunit
LGEQIAADDTRDSGTAQLRLETDAALVKVITQHKAKGLQYPVVFLPFSYTSAVPRTEGGEEKDDPKTLQRIEDEKAESLRLLYVALTRAERALFMAAATPNWLPDRTSLYKLLNRRDKTDLQQKLAVWAQCPDISVEQLPLPSLLTWQGNSTLAVQRHASEPVRSHRSTWRSSSFSSMTRDLHQHAALPLTAQDELREDRRTDVDGEPAISRLNTRWSALKGSNRLGTALHELLECQLLEGWPEPATCRSPSWLKLLRKHVRSLAPEQVTAEQLTQWVQACTRAALPLR